MTQILVLSTTFDFSGMNFDDEENSAILALDQIIDWLENGDEDCELAEAIEEECRFATYCDLPNAAARVKLAADLKAGKMLKLGSEQSQVVLAPVVPEEGESDKETVERTLKAAKAAMKTMCD